MVEVGSPRVPIDTSWLQGHTDDPNVRIVEVDEDTGMNALGHIPNAIPWNWFEDLPWSRGVNEDGTFKSAGELTELYSGAGVQRGLPVVAYCRIGERSTHTWFLLHELLGYPTVANYDGSWTECGSLVGVAVER